jgi:hypothetical protein
MLLRAWSLLDRPPILVLTVLLASGQPRSYRLVPGIARAGFLISPVIEEDDEFVRLASGRRATLAPHEVEAISVASSDSNDPSWAYGPEYEVRFFALDIEP